MDISNISWPINFDEEITADPELKTYLEKICEERQLLYTEPLEQEQAPRLNEDFSNTFIISNLPLTDQAKVPKLKKLLMKIFKKKGADYIIEENVEMPLAGEKNAGCAIVTVKTTTQARLAAEGINGFSLDKKHVLTAATWSEFERVIQIPDEDTAFELPKFASLEDLKSYQIDPFSSEYYLQVGSNIEISQPNLVSLQTAQDNFENAETISLLGRRRKSTKIHLRYSTWSPQGTFLLFIDNDKVEIVGGSNFETVANFMYPNALEANISPCEKYVLIKSKVKKGFISGLQYSICRIDDGREVRSFEEEADRKD